MRPADTSPEIWEIYRRRLSEMTPQEKINQVADMWNVADSIQRSAMRLLHPDAGEDEITFLVASARYGEELARKAYRR